MKTLKEVQKHLNENFYSEEDANRIFQLLESNGIYEVTVYCDGNQRNFIDFYDWFYSEDKSEEISDLGGGEFVIAKDTRGRILIVHKGSASAIYLSEILEKLPSDTILNM